jgi:HEAT repeat protein
LLIVCGGGCHKPKVQFKPAVLATERDVVGYVNLALEHEDADVRRVSINRIAQTRYRSKPAVVDALDLIARTDGSDAVRCAAIRALGESGDAKATGTMLAILDEKSDATTRNAGDDVRWEAVEVLGRRAESGEAAQEQRAAVRRTALRLLAGDPSRDVRLSAARLLGSDSSMEAVHGLIDALRQRDFGVAYEAEQSLTRLTGQTFDHDSTRWAEWLASANDPFPGHDEHTKASERTSQ